METPSFGMPSLVELDGLEEHSSVCLDLGLSFVELNMNLPFFQLEKLDSKRLREAQKKGLGFTIHLDENINAADFNSSVAQAYQESILRTIDFAQENDIPVLNMHMHPGVWFTLPDGRVYLFEKYRDAYYEKLRLFREACTRAVGNSPVKICLENCGDPAFIKEAMLFLLESPVFGLTLDVGHDHGAGGIDLPFFLEHQQRLCHMHLHDARGRKNHMVLGTGEVDLAQRLELARAHHCRCVLEIKTLQALKDSLRYLKWGLLS